MTTPFGAAATAGKLLKLSTEWQATALSIAGSYGRNDSVDVHYNLHGKRQVAVGLDIELLDSERDANRADTR